MFYFADYNKLISGIENTITEPDCKNPGFSTHLRLSEIVDLLTTYCPYLHYICLGCSVGLLPRQQFFRKKHLNCFITLSKIM
jgi:hypothetical protein